MNVTVRDLLRAPLFRHSIVLAGKGGLDKQISSVTILDSPDGHVYLKGGELVITAAYSAVNNDTQQAALIENLAAKNAAALGINLRFFDDHLSSSMQEKAEQLNFPVITISNDVVYSDILNFFMDYIMCRETKVFMRKEEALQMFLQCMVSEGFSGVTGMLHRWTGLPAGIIYEQKQFQEPHNFLPDNFLENPRNYKHRLLSHDPDFPDTIKANNSFRDENRPDWIGTELNFKGKHKGYLLLWAGKRNFEKDDTVLLGFAATACQMEMQRIAALHSEQQKYKNHFLDQLFRNQFASYQEAAGRAQELKWELPPEAMVVVVRWLDSSIDVLPTLNYVLYSQCYQHLIASVNDQQHELILITSQDAVADKIIEKLIETFKSTFPNVKFFAGLGRPVPYHQLSQSLKEAHHALQVSASIENGPAINYFEKLGAYRLIAMAELKEEVKKYYQDYLEPLINYDQVNNTELTHTLELFLENNCNYRKAARILYVHPNTIRYRINLAEKIINLDLADPDNRFNLQLALRISPFVNGSTGLDKS